MIFDAEIIDIIKRTDDMKSFRFKMPQDLQFKPGQFLSITINTGEDLETRYLSISNSPTEKGYIECTKKISTSRFSRAINNMQMGDYAKLSAPLGNFTFSGEYPKIAFLSGGIGITPIRSMCKFAVDMKLPSDIVLLYGNSREENIVFKNDFDEMTEKNDRLRVVYTLTTPGLDFSLWKGRKGCIDSQMIRSEIPDYPERVFYACGPPKMVLNLVNILKEEICILEENIKTENFIGY